MTAKPTHQDLEYPALELRQGDRTLYSFAVDGKDLAKFATVSRVRRKSDTTLRGYQRPEVLSHIASIRKYIESENPIVPNALVIAFDDRVRFEPSPQANGHPYSRPGKLVIPFDSETPAHERPGWIVDGQQRTAAVREARVDSFPLFVTAFITDDEQEQRSQFILVNATKPLARSLIYELLPSTEGRLPLGLEARRFPAYLAERLNYDADSPLRGLIRTPTAAEGVIKDNSILRMLENSLTDGALYFFRDPDTGRGDVDSMLDILKNYWTAVSKVFADAWALPPRKSRLMHGVGVISLGFVMDAISDRHWKIDIPTVDQYSSDLELIAPLCSWTGGYWEFGGDYRINWNELQNLQKDINLLTNHLLSAYRSQTKRM